MALYHSNEIQEIIGRNTDAYSLLERFARRPPLEPNGLAGDEYAELRKFSSIVKVCRLASAVIRTGESFGKVESNAVGWKKGYQDIMRRQYSRVADVSYAIRRRFFLRAYLSNPSQANRVRTMGRLGLTSLGIDRETGLVRFSRQTTVRGRPVRQDSSINPKAKASLGYGFWNDYRKLVSGLSQALVPGAGQESRLREDAVLDARAEGLARQIRRISKKKGGEDAAILRLANGNNITLAHRLALREGPTGELSRKAVILAKRASKTADRIIMVGFDGIAKEHVTAILALPPLEQKAVLSRLPERLHTFSREMAKALGFRRMTLLRGRSDPVRRARMLNLIHDSLPEGHPGKKRVANVLDQARKLNWTIKEMRRELRME